MDTICINLNNKDAGNIDFIDVVKRQLPQCNEHYYSNNDKYVLTGNFRNMKVTASNENIKIENSLTKMFLGDNIKMLSKKDVKSAIDLLSDELQLPFKHSKVSKLHFGLNIMLQHPVNLYLPYLGLNGRYTRLMQPTSLEYRTKARQFVLYDKIAQMKASKEPINQLYENKNVLRIEKRYNARFADYFNMPEIRASNLYSDNLYTLLVNDWIKDFRNIKINKQLKLDMDNITTVKDQQRLGILVLIEKLGGKQQALNELNERYAKGIITKKQKFDIKKAYEDAEKLSAIYVENDLTKELTSKVYQVSKYRY